MMTLSSLIVLLSLVGSLGLISGIGTAEAQSEVTVTNAIGSSTPGCEETNECFVPSTVTVDVGGTVNWENVDNAAHTVTSGSPTDGPDGVFDSSLIMVGGPTFSVTFDTAGTFPYFCQVHPWMQATVIVAAAMAEEEMMEKEMMEKEMMEKEMMEKEIPYTFTNRMYGSSKLDSSTMWDYVRSVWRLYRYGHKVKDDETRTSVRFISKAGRFFTVGASGLLVNYLVSLLFADAIINFWYIHATLIGILVSMSSNFLLNKVWTFEDRNFEAKKTLIQYGKFVGFSSLGALIQLGIVFVLVDTYQFVYPLALILAVVTAASSNFILNKKWTFKEKVWS